MDKKRHKDIRLKRGYFLAPVFRVTNSNKEALEEINKFIKGKIVSNGLSKNLNHKQVYRIEVTDLKRIKDVLKEVKPYLIIKKVHATLMIDFCNKRLKAKDKKYTEEDYSVSGLFSKLNKNGGVS